MDSISSSQCAWRHLTIGSPHLIRRTTGRLRLQVCSRVASASPRQRCLCYHVPLPIAVKRQIDASAAPKSQNSVSSSSHTKPSACQTQNLQDVVIVGGGIAGMATALALHRLGIKPLLLERAEELRTEGTTIVLWPNAWKALESLDVADNLRKRFERLSGVEFLLEDGTSLLDLKFSAASRDVEVRGVHRKTLLEVLREPLPDNTILYDSHVIGIRNLDGGFTEVQCENGQKFKTKVLIGCDGASSVVANWMHMEPPNYAGYTAIRGLCVYPNGHGRSYKLHQMLGRGVRAGIVPIDANRVYWFVVFNVSGPKVSDIESIRKEALDHVQGWSAMITEAIKMSPADTLSRKGIFDRWVQPMGGPFLYRNEATLAGDAMHPVTPNLGQGGCLALEDAVVLARELAKALLWSSDLHAMDTKQKEVERIQRALQFYTNARCPRVLSLAVKSYAMGALLQVENALFCSIRNKVLPKLLSVESFVGHTFYEF